MKKIELIVVPAGHQFTNPVEQSIKEVKKIFRGLNEKANSSLYAPPNNMMDLISQDSPNRECNVSTTHSTDQNSTVIMPRLLFHPLMTLSAVDMFVPPYLNRISQ